MFGLQDNDPARFPVAVRDVIEFPGETDVPVLESRAAITLERTGGERLRLTRDIKGSPPNVVVEELAADGRVTRTSTLLARKQTMKDETAGLQNFVFSWCGLPRTAVVDNRGEPSELYLENIAPLFYIDQAEGWTDLQALQVHRYGLLEISDIAVEYLLGAVEAIEARFASRPSRRARLSSKPRPKPSPRGQRTLSAPRLDHAVVGPRQRSMLWQSAGARGLHATLKEELNIDLGADASRLRTR